MPAEIGRRVFPASSEEVEGVLAFIAGLAERSGVGSEKGSRLELAVEEWVVNLCTHAYRSSGGSIEVAVRAGRSDFMVEIADEGPPFDPTATPDPDVAAPLAERTPGGLGLMLIRRMVDEVRYRRESERNVLTLAVGTRHS